MAFLTTRERAFLQAVFKLAYSNPFLPERVQYMREALGKDYDKADSDWMRRGLGDEPGPSDNHLKISQRVEAMMPKLRARLASGPSATEEELVLYEEAVLFLFYYRFQARFEEIILRMLDQEAGSGGFGFYSDFRGEFEFYRHIPGVNLPTKLDAAHIFACFFQICRAFPLIFRHIIGGAVVASRLRAEVWQSIFTHDLRRYRNSLYKRMDDLTTLITGPSGTGKELVARAIGLSRYIPFDTKTMTFRLDFAGSFHALNISALPPQLIESELFGHKRGAFTGALQDRRGWLEVCQPNGTVFLDEIGDLDPSIQVKLLRVFQTRTFQAVGDTQEKHFCGKIIAATNRDLAEAMQAKQFREDFYYRLCSDIIVTPSLHEQLAESPDVLRDLLVFIAHRVTDEGAEALAEEVEAWIEKNLGRDYRWPGNIRELEQCVRSVLIRKAYQPPRARALPSHEEFLKEATSEALTADEMLRRYCTLVYSRTGSYEETARRLRLDPRTVKAKIDRNLLS